MRVDKLYSDLKVFSKTQSAENSRRRTRNYAPARALCTPLPSVYKKLLRKEWRTIKIMISQ